MSFGRARFRILVGIALGVPLAGTAVAQQDDHTGHAGHEGHTGHERQEAHAAHEGHAGHAHHVARDPHDAGNAIPPDLQPPTDADRAAAFPPLSRPMQHPPSRNGALLVERLEAVDNDAGTGLAWETTGWYGTDLDRLWVRAEGERSSGNLEAASAELLYGRSVAPWWDVVAGVRHDFAPGDARTWAAIGVQGLAPGLVEVRLTGHLSGSGRTALVVEAEYDLLLTPRIVLQPVLEATAFGRSEAARGTGSGLSSVEAGLRLRYEITPRVGPYLGLVHERRVGRTGDLAEAAGGKRRDTRVVAGLRFSF